MVIKAPSPPLVGIPIMQHCLEGPLELLSQTHVVQPALFAHSLTLTDYAQRFGLKPVIVAGHNLGEYTVAVAAGVLSFEDGLYLVIQRGKLMYRLQDEQPGAMAAIVGLAAEDLYDLCARISNKHFVAITDWNTRTQFVVSGKVAGVQTLLESGCDTFVELGDSQVLTRLVRSIAPESKTFTVNTLDKIAALAETLDSPTRA